MTEWTLSGALNRALVRRARRRTDASLVFGEDVGRERRRVPRDRRAPGRVRRPAGVRHADQRGGDRRRGRRACASRAGARWSSCSSTRSPIPRSSRSSITSRRCGCARADASTCRSRSASPSFGGIKGKEHHGESPETYYAHTAGLKVVVPSSALDGYTLLRHAIADPDPVVVLEPKASYWAKEDGELDDRRARRSAWAACSATATTSRWWPTARWSRAPARPPTRSRDAASRRASSTSARSPRSTTTCCERCAEETGRIVVIHEAPRHVGIGAEIAARVMELAFDSLAAPVAARDRLGHAVPAGLARGRLPAERRPDRRPRPERRWPTDGRARLRRCRTSARASRRARSSSGSSPRATRSR